MVCVVVVCVCVGGGGEGGGGATRPTYLNEYIFQTIALFH